MLYKLEVKTIKRYAPPRDGDPTVTRRTATAAAAYRSGTAITDARTGDLYDFTHRRGIEHTEIVTPPGVPKPDRERLWNTAEAAEKRYNSVVAREIMIALPPGDDARARQTRRTLTLAFAAYIAATHGCAVDVAIHRPPRDGDERNYHAHLLITTRRIERDGSLGPKTRELDDRKSGAVEDMRTEWADLVNEHLKRSGSAERVDHRSYRRQKKAKLPSVHLGHLATKNERNGIKTERGDYNRAVDIINTALARTDLAGRTKAEIWSAAAEAAKDEIDRRARAARWQKQKTLAQTTKDPAPPMAEPEKKKRTFVIGSRDRAALIGSGPSAEKKAAKAAQEEAARQAAEAAAAAEQEKERKNKQIQNPAIGLKGRQPRQETELERRQREHRQDMEQAGVYIKKPTRRSGQEQTR